MTQQLRLICCAAGSGAAMIEALRLAELQAITHGTLHGADVSFTAVSTDTRTLQKDDLFIALKGPNFNGNLYVSEAGRKAACAAVVSENVKADIPTLQVADTRIALGQLGAENRRRSSSIVIGLTGSQGKTTVKEMTAAILARCGAVHSTRGNLNNDFGVPLTLLQITAEHRFAVIEMGANAPGEIAYTTSLTRPDIAHITNIAPTHLEGFGSLEGVARAKAELWTGLQQDGTAIINLDDPNIPTNFADGSRRKVTVSAQGRTGADYLVQACEDLGLAGSRFSMKTPAGVAEVHLKLPGRHNVANALAAAAMAMEAGATLAHVTDGLGNAGGVKGRLTVRKGLGGAVVLDDTYNASPASFRAAIDVLCREHGRKFLVAGDMGELGEAAEAAHASLGKSARESGVERLFATGRLSQLTVAAFGDGATHFDTCEALAVHLRRLLARGVTVLVKGSRSAGMERVVKLITEEEG
jgi:UDP-N-acetylmuramoyl-tripeptide--D-alanyl-D-alanine ligase